MNKRKKKSLSAIIKDLRDAKNRWESHYWEEAQKNSALREKISLLKKIVPYYFYRIKFNMKANDEKTYDYNQIVEGPSPQLAIEFYKVDKTYPESFKLLDIEKLA